MQKTLIFYELELVENPQINLFNGNETLKDRFKDFSENAKESDYLYTNNSKIIEIKDVDENHIFGSYGKIENLSKKELTRGRTKEDYLVTDLDSLKELIESYTYFYLDINMKQCVILSNSKCTGFKSEFANFLKHHFRISGIYTSVRIVNRLSKNIRESIGRATNISNISYTYVSENLPENEFASFKEMSGLRSDQIKTANVRLFLEPKLDHQKSIKTLAKNFGSSTDKFDSFKIETDEEYIDVIEKTLSKKVSIKIDEDSLNNLDKINNILRDNLYSANR